MKLIWIAMIVTVGLALRAQIPGRPAEPALRGRVIGIGGVFFETEHPRDLAKWYQAHLGFKPDPKIGVVLPWCAPGAEQPKIYRTTWAAFPKNAHYFGTSKSCLMVNYIVDDLDAILARLKTEGVLIDSKREADEAGRFGWIYDSDGNKVELWEPAQAQQAPR